MQRLLLIVALIVLSGGLAAGVSARETSRVTGTKKADVLKGTSRADTILGLAGNDRISGLAGNDVLVGGTGNDRLTGGPGTDRVRCGAGRDTVKADALDRVASDCEVVTGRPKPEPTPEPPAEPPSNPPPPPAPHAVGGRYCGFTNQGKSICFTVSPDGARVSDFATTSEVNCETAIGTFGLSFGDSTPVRSDLTFSYTYNGSLNSGEGFTNMTTNYTVAGTFDQAGNAKGSLSLNRLSFDYQGTHYNCAAATYAWQARAGA